MKYSSLFALLTAYLVLPAQPATADEVVLSPVEQLGQQLYTDINLSKHRNQSCETCHSLSPAANPAIPASAVVSGFVDNENVMSGQPVSAGSEAGASGSLNAPSVAYARFSPAFHWNSEEGLYMGGQFWNGRATNLAKQAEGPFLNSVEMALPSKWAVITRLKESREYRRAFSRLFGIRLAGIPAYELAPAEVKPPRGVEEAYDKLTEAIAAFEKSRIFNRFTAKFDYVIAGMAEFTAEEQLGFELFTGDRAQCSACHTADLGIAIGGGDQPPMFTDFSYDNLGVPRNVNIPGNPEPDLGLGGREDIAAADPAGEELGKHKVMTLRNVEITGPYMHNGVFQNLDQVVHFYNTRDIKPAVCVDNDDPGFADQCWPAPEIPQNVNDSELGNLGLSAAEEASIVAFMKTLTDGYPDWGNDPAVPPGTLSPYADMPLPPSP